MGTFAVCGYYLYIILTNVLSFNRFVTICFPSFADIVFSKLATKVKVFDFEPNIYLNEIYQTAIFIQLWICFCLFWTVIPLIAYTYLARFVYYTKLYIWNYDFTFAYTTQVMEMQIRHNFTQLFLGVLWYMIAICYIIYLKVS